MSQAENTLVYPSPANRGKFGGWFYGPCTVRGGSDHPPVQRDSRPLGRINPLIHELAWAEYAAQGHGSQDAKRIAERGGFSEHELIALLGDALLRQKGYQAGRGR